MARLCSFPYAPFINRVDTPRRRSKIIVSVSKSLIREKVWGELRHVWEEGEVTAAGEGGLRSSCDVEEGMKRLWNRMVRVVTIFTSVSISKYTSRAFSGGLFVVVFCRLNVSIVR